VLSNRRFKGPELLPFFPSVEQICCHAFPRAKPYTESTASSADYSQSLGGIKKEYGEDISRGYGAWPQPFSMFNRQRLSYHQD